MQTLKKWLLSTIETPIFIACIFAFFLIIRLAALHADPSPIKFQPEILDEGFWIHNARNMALFGKWVIDDLVQAFVGAPFFNFLLFLSFKFLGVGFFQARIVCAVAGWLTVLLVFLILKREYPVRTAVVSSAMIGLMAEFITYNRVALPESLQILFIALAFYLWSLSSKENFWSPLASGVSFAFAFLSKISAYHVFPAIAVLWLLEWLSGKFSLRSAISLSLGFLAVILTWFFAYYAPNVSLYKLFMATNGSYTLMTGNYLLYVINQCLMFFYNPLYVMPSVTLLLFVLIPYLAHTISGSIKDLRGTVKGLSFAEMLSVAWLVGGNASLIVISDNSLRRYVMFIVPIVILSTIALLHKNEEIRASISQLRAPKGLIRYVILFILLYTFATSTGNLLTLSLLFFLAGLAWAVAYSRGHGGFDAWLFIFSSLLAIPFAANMTFFLDSTSLFISDPFSRCVFAFVSFILLSVCGLFMAGKGKQAVTVILTSFICWNIFVLGVWAVKPSFSLYDASSYIRTVSNKGDVLVGSYAHLLSLENNTLPLWWSPDQVYQDQINKEKIYTYYPRFIMYSSRNVTEKNKPGYFMGINMFGNRIVDMSLFHLMPFAFKDAYCRTFHFAELRGSKRETR